jgi:tripartite-type tricarboxylate transporter receptor subunit TctC
LLATEGTGAILSSKPLAMIIPLAAGGPTDVGRVMAQRMSEILGQQVVVENVAAPAA